MIERIINALGQGEKYNEQYIRSWFSVALTKKLGVFKMPYSMWSADPKINPPAEYLLWSAILLEDHEAMGVAEGVIFTEISERSRFSRVQPELQQIINQYITNLLQKIPSGDLKNRVAAFTGKSSFSP